MAFVNFVRQENIGQVVRKIGGLYVVTQILYCPIDNGPYHLSA